jgi:TolB-like protein/DNA-binding winged helix-turn-helix (wHTH) protein/Tfp pilus assembly protein PilF
VEHVQRDFQVGDWLVHPSLNTFERTDRTVHVEPKVMQVLLLLVEHSGEVVSKDTLLRNVWQDTFVTEDVLVRCISELRKIFEDSPRQPRVIQTIHKNGYRLLPPVRRLNDSSTANLVIPAAPSIPKRDALEKAAFLHNPRLICGVVVLLFALAGWTSYQHFRSSYGRARPKVLLVVLPFENLSGDPEQDFFADGITEEMITQLSTLRPDELGVIARVSAMRYKQHRPKLSDVHQELNVEYALEGSVRRSGDKVRITAQLIELRDQSQLWAQSYDRELRDVLSVQADVAEAVARVVRLKMSPVDEVALASRSTPSPEGYDNYLKGQYHLHRYMRDDPQKALTYFKRALTTDPGFAAAHVSLAGCYVASAFDEVPPSEAMPRAEAEALSALELDPNSATAHAILSEINLRYHWDWPGAEREARRALELNPNLLDAHDAFSDYLVVMGEDQEALVERQRTLELDPFWPEMSVEMANLLERQKRYDEAIAAFRHAVELDPQSENDFHWSLGDVYGRKGMFKEHIKEWVDALRGRGQQERADKMAQLYAAKGYMAALNFFLETAVQRRLARQSRGEYVDPLGIADLYVRLGNRKQAFVYLNRAYHHRSYGLTFFLQENSSLAGEPEFNDLVHRIGLPQPRMTRASN